MNEILNFITEAGTFYIATTDGVKPKVRPFGFIMEHEGKLYFCTSNQKDVYKQMISNPYCEICAMSANGQWIRLQGKAVFDSNIAAKAKAFEIMPNLARIYNAPDNPIFEVFYLSEGEATFYSFSDQPRTVTL
ncbi:pyridoxamine 5'-phosphate oxidase family protein [Desulfosporosinus fructosivorans]